MIRNVAKTKEYKVLILGDARVGKTTMLQYRETKRFNPNTGVTQGVNIGVNHVMNRELYAAAGLLGITQFDQGIENVFQYWDLGGQTIYDQMRQVYFQGASGIMLCFDISNPETLRRSYGTNGDIGIDNTITRFIEQIITFFGKVEAKKMPILLIGTKTDIGRGIPDERIEYLASELKKAGLNIVSYRIMNSDQLYVFGKWTGGREKFTQDEIGKKWIETSSKTGFNVETAFHAIELAIKGQQRLNEIDSRTLAMRRDQVAEKRETAKRPSPMKDLTKRWN